MKKAHIISFFVVFILWMMDFSIAVSQNVTLVEIAQIDNSKYPEVTLYVRVLDENGEKVNNLTQDQFSIIEDGQSTEIVGFTSENSQAISTILIIDISSSMQDNGKIGGAKDAANAFIDMMRRDDQTAIVAFNQQSSLIQDFISDKNALLETVDALYAIGNTAWHDAVFVSSTKLTAVQGRKSIILLSDGQDNESQYSLNDAINAANEANAPVYAIGLGSGSDIDQQGLSAVANDTSGKFYMTPSIDELKKLFQDISQTTQEEYVITYRSPRPTFDGTRRNIEIKIGTISGQGNYTESHLINIKSDLLVGLLYLLPLLLFLVVPLLFRTITMPSTTGRSDKPVLGNAMTKNSEGMAIAAPEQNLSIKAVICSNCGHQLRSGARFCATCGTAISQVNQGLKSFAEVSKPRFCRKCGEKLRPESKFCSICGTRVDM